MLPLDCRRPLPAALARLTATLPGFRQTLDDHWPIAWAVLFLLLPAAGRHWQLPDLGLTTAMAVRLAAVLPLAGRLLTAPRLLGVGAAPGAWVVTLLLAAWAGSLAAGDLSRRPPATAPDWNSPSAWVQTDGAAALRLTARPRPGSGERWSAPARLLSWESEDPSLVAPRAGEGVLIRSDGEPPPLGTVLGGTWRLRPPRRAPVQGGFDEAAWLLGRHLQWVATPAPSTIEAPLLQAGWAAVAGRVQTSAQSSLRDHLFRGLPPREATLAAAVLLGGGVPSDLREPFVRLGLAHLFALSGLHVGIVGGLLLLIFKPLARGDGWKLILMSLALGAYTVLIDAPASVVRATGLVLVTLGLKAAGRRIDGLRILGLLLWLNLLWEPASLLDVGLRLSYLAAGGIVVGQRLVAPRLRNWPRAGRWTASAFTVSLSAQVATLPVIADSFGVLPLAGPLINVVAVPVFGLAATGLGAGLLLAVAWPWAGEALLACSWLLLRPMQAAAQMGQDLAWLERGLPVWGPGRWLVYAGQVVLLVIMLRRLPARRLGWCAGLMVAMLVTAGALPPGWSLGDQGKVQAWQFDVGQGDCALIRLPDGFTCLIDTGGAWRRGGSNLKRDILPFLRRLQVRRLDAVILTHGHADHTGGSRDLQAALPVDAWYAGGSASPPDTVLTALRPAAGDTLHASGAWALVWLYPPADRTATGGENDQSLSLGLCRDGRLLGLWTGDLETGGERALLANLPPVPEEGLSYWKAGHHGSRTSGSDALLAALRPQLIVISCGVANRHRHPSHAALPEHALARTDLQQTVHLVWDRTGRLAWQPLQRWSPPVASVAP